MGRPLASALYACRNRLRLLYLRSRDEHPGDLCKVVQSWRAAIGPVELVQVSMTHAGDGLVEELCLEARRRDRIAKDSQQEQRSP